MALASNVKGALSVFEYYVKMKKLADEMDVAGKKWILKSSHHMFSSGWTWNTTRLYLLPLHVSSLSHLVNCSLRCHHAWSWWSRSRGGRGRGRGIFSRGCRRGAGPNNNNRPQCQLCGKIGHVVLKCWK
jgi:hypothetical protein